MNVSRHRGCQIRATVLTIIPAYVPADSWPFEGLFIRYAFDGLASALTAYGSARLHFKSRLEFRLAMWCGNLPGTAHY